MKKSREFRRLQENPVAWHADFEAMLPSIETHARIAFRHLKPEAKAEAVQETILQCLPGLCTARRVGQDRRGLPDGAGEVRGASDQGGSQGRRQLNVRDVSSGYCQQRKNLLVQRLDHYDSEEEAWSEVLVEDRHAVPPRRRSCGLTSPRG